ncbi:MAG: peptidoglycan editing factor PgeF [Pseudomonadales bacterium]
MTDLIPADWPAPPHVHAYVTTRREGVSNTPYASNNLALHVGDHAQAVQQNRELLVAALQGCNAIQWLDQVHGTVVNTVKKAGNPLSGDGLQTDVSGLACAVLTADCLPVFLTDRTGSEVNVVHAGWRGLAAGILACAVQTLRAPPAELLAWLGPAISQSHFEVATEVAQQLQMSTSEEQPLVDMPSQATSGKVMVDLYHVAKCQLQQLGLTEIFGGNFCTYTDIERFYSYRRDGVTGRMASVIYLT